MALHVGLQLEFRIAWTGNQCVAGMIERPHDTMQKLIIHGMLGTVFVIPLVMSALCRGMLEYELDFTRGADVKDLRLMAINEDDGVEIFTHKFMSWILSAVAFIRQSRGRFEGFQRDLNRRGAIPCQGCHYNAIAGRQSSESNRIEWCAHSSLAI